MFLMAQPPHRNSGTPRSRAREVRRLVRDRKIYRFMRLMADYADSLHQLANEPIEPLSVYMGKPFKAGIPNITPFPIVTQKNGRRMPLWEDLSQWMKVQLVTMVLKGEFLTFNIRIHPDLEERWTPSGKPAVDDPRRKMAERIRKELDNSLGKGREFFFVIEGWSKDTQAPTYLHFHGGAALRDAGDEGKIEVAVGRAAGHGLNGFAKIARAVHTAPFSVEQAAYANYLFKAANRYDPRLPDKRLAISNSMTDTARLFWETITRDVDDWRHPY